MEPTTMNLNMDNNIMEEFVVPDGLFEALEKIDYENIVQHFTWC